MSHILPYLRKQGSRASVRETPPWRNDLNDHDPLSKAAKEAQKVLEQSSQISKVRDALDSPAIKALRSIEENSSVQKLLQDVERHTTLMRVAEGPLAELRSAGLFDSTSPFLQELPRIQQIMSEFGARFELPQFDRMDRLTEQFQQSQFTGVLARYAEQTSTLQKAMASMQTPWLDAQEALHSVSGFAGLQGIGSVLNKFPTFDDRVTQALRIDLGDWRDPITWTDEITTDLTARSLAYSEFGFDSALTDFPAPAFQEAITIAGLRRELPTLVQLYGRPAPQPDDDAEEQALVRTNEAHDTLLRLETQIRKFIDDEMTHLFGDDWPKKRLPKDVFDKWQQKKRDAEKQGARVWPIISYADFTDYERVICRRDNWRELFAAYFVRPESVRETFQRLYPIRLDTMHARPITQDDELLLYVETRRLVRVFKF